MLLGHKKIRMATKSHSFTVTTCQRMPKVIIRHVRSNASWSKCLSSLLKTCKYWALHTTHIFSGNFWLRQLITCIDDHKVTLRSFTSSRSHNGHHRPRGVKMKICKLHFIVLRTMRPVYCALFYGPSTVCGWWKHENDTKRTQLVTCSLQCVRGTVSRLILTMAMGAGGDSFNTPLLYYVSYQG